MSNSIVMLLARGNEYSQRSQAIIAQGSFSSARCRGRNPQAKAALSCILLLSFAAI
jgi:hypothetical protein